MASASAGVMLRSALGSTNTGSLLSDWPARSSSSPASAAGAPAISTKATAAAMTERTRRISTPIPLLITTGRSLSEVAAASLLALDGLEQGLEVAGAEPLGPFALDDLEEDGRPVGDRLGEDLQQVPVVVAVDEDAEPLQLVPRQVELGEPHPHVVVVAVRHGEEPDAPLPQRADRGDDVGRAQRDVLHAGAAVEVEVLLDLALLAAVGRLVDRQDHRGSVPHHRRHQRRVL